MKARTQKQCNGSMISSTISYTLHITKQSCKNLCPAHASSSRSDPLEAAGSFNPTDLMKTQILVYAFLAALCAAGFAECDGSHLNPPLSFDFYAKSCPKFEKIVAERVAYYSGQDDTTPAPLLRLFFHDCFVQGCDASVLLNSSKKVAAEKDASINFSLGNFNVIDDIKSHLEKECPGTVSCADILAETAVYSIKQAGGPLYPIELGRRDALTSYANNAQVFLPAFSLKIDGLIENFANVGLDKLDLVTLSGAHTIGQSHCSSVKNRIYPKIDSAYKAGYGQQILSNCTDNFKLKAPKFDTDVQMFMDPVTTIKFDNQYYKNLKLGYGLFTADIALLSRKDTKAIVENFAANQQAFFKQFGISLRKMGKIGVLTGTQGQIRKKCWIRNSHNPDPALNP